MMYVLHDCCLGIIIKELWFALIHNRFLFVLLSWIVIRKLTIILGFFFDFFYAISNSYIFYTPHICGIITIL